MKIVKLIYSWILIKIRHINIALFGHSSYRKVVIVCQARTGSNLLVSLLNSHPNVSISGEIFDFLNGQSTKDIWNNQFKKYPKKIKVVGFKIFYQHPFDGEKDVWGIINKDPSILIIHLTRKNTLRSYISLKIAEKTNRWHESINSKDFPSEKKIKVDIEEYSKYCIKTDNYIKLTQKHFSKSHDFIELSFEELTKDNQKCINKISASLALETFYVSTKMIRQNPEPLNNLIINYNEVESFMNSADKKEFINFSNS